MQQVLHHRWAICCPASMQMAASKPHRSVDRNSGFRSCASAGGRASEPHQRAIGWLSTPESGAHANLVPPSPGDPGGRTAAVLQLALIPWGTPAEENGNLPWAKHFFRASGKGVAHLSLSPSLPLSLINMFPEGRADLRALSAFLYGDASTPHTTPGWQKQTRTV